MRKSLLILLALPVVMSGCNSKPINPINTYTLGELEENNITEIDILVFRVDPNTGQEKYLYRIYNDEVSLADATTTGDRKKYSLKVKYSDGTNKDRLVFLANMSKEIDSAIIPADVNNTVKDELLQRLVLNTSGKWEANLKKPVYRSIPMWGESWATYNFKDESPSTIVGNVLLIRALARIDVGLNYDVNHVAQGLNNFVLAQVRVLNSNNKAIGVPKQGNYSADPTTGITISATTIPSGTAPNQPLTYTVASGKHSIDGAIYVSEMTPTIIPQPLPADFHDQFHILIGGYFSTADQIAAGTPNTTKITWYRGDIHTIGQEPQGSRIDILRGHLYRFDIREVTGPGEENTDDATEYLKSMRMISTVKAFVPGGSDGEVSIGL